MAKLRPLRDAAGLQTEPPLIRAGSAPVRHGPGRDARLNVSRAAGGAVGVVGPKPVLEPRLGGLVVGKRVGQPDQGNALSVRCSRCVVGRAISGPPSLSLTSEGHHVTGILYHVFNTLYDSDEWSSQRISRSGRLDSNRALPIDHLGVLPLTPCPNLRSGAQWRAELSCSDWIPGSGVVGINNHFNGLPGIWHYRK